MTGLILIIIIISLLGRGLFRPWGMWGMFRRPWMGGMWMDHRPPMGGPHDFGGPHGPGMGGHGGPHGPGMF